MNKYTKNSKESTFNYPLPYSLFFKIISKSLINSINYIVLFNTQSKENLALTEFSCQCHPNVITYQQLLAGKTRKSSMIIITYLSQKSLIKYLEDADINLNSNFKLPENTVLQFFLHRKSIMLMKCVAYHMFCYIYDQSMKLRIDTDW